MLINVGDLKKEPLRIFTYNFREGLGELDWLLFPVDLNDLYNEVVINMEVYYSDSSVFLSGNMETNYTQECSRCLESYNQNSKNVFNEELKLITVEGERFLKGEAEEKFILEGDRVDLSEYFRQLFVVSLEMKPLCHHDCMGLCSSCGVNLNLCSCNCYTEQIDPRFAELKKLKAQLEEKE